MIGDPLVKCAAVTEGLQRRLVSCVKPRKHLGDHKSEDGVVWVASEPDLFKSVPEADVEKLPRLSVEEIEAALERGREEAEKVRRATHPAELSGRRYR